MSKQKITTHLWYDTQAKEAAEFYVSAFGGDSSILSINQIHNTPSGSVDIVNFKLHDKEFTAISAGPIFKFNPSISFFVACDTIEETENLWNKLKEGGNVLMEFGEYPFSPKYGWLNDKYGLSWQIMFMNNQPYKQKIIPKLTFVGKVAGKSEEAINFYKSVFHNSEVNFVQRYGKGVEPDKEGTIMHAGFMLEGQQFAAMDSAHKHDFAFNEAISFLVHCQTQEEIDYYWEKLSAVPESEQCGWLKDKFGLSWQIVSDDLDKVMASGDKEKIARVTEAFLQMKKFDLKKLAEAAEGK